MEASATEPAKMIVAVSAPSVVRKVESKEQVTTAKSFQPPTPTEIAQGDNTKHAFYVSAALVVIGLALFYFQHGKAGGIALIGAILVPALEKFANSNIAIAALVGTVGVCSALVVAWYLLKPKIKLAASLPPDSEQAKHLSHE